MSDPLEILNNWREESLDPKKKNTVSNEKSLTDGQITGLQDMGMSAERAEQLRLVNIYAKARKEAGNLTPIPTLHEIGLQAIASHIRKTEVEPLISLLKRTSDALHARVVWNVNLMRDVDKALAAYQTTKEGSGE